MKNLVLGVTGGIAAYKAADLVSLLRDRQIASRAAMTAAATRFLGPLTLASLTGHPVLLDDLGQDADPSIPHIAWARWADGVAVVPTTADFLGRLAHGLASDSLSSLVLALEQEKPVILAPAMNSEMWHNPLVQRNLALLRDVGADHFRVVEPVEKRLACGEHGIGGLADVELIADAIQEALGRTG